MTSGTRSSRVRQGGKQKGRRRRGPGCVPMNTPGPAPPWRFSMQTKRILGTIGRTLLIARRT
jgi:hypothetical protein